MVKQGLKYLTIASLLTVLGAVGLAGWLLGTTPGARFLLRAVSACSGLRIKAASIHGRLANTVIMDQFQAQWPQGNIQINRLQLKGNLVELWHRKAMRLEIRGQGLDWNKRPLDSVRLTLNGFPGDHRLNLEAGWPGGRAWAALAGGLLAFGWQGTLKEALVEDIQLGRWALKAPAHVHLSAGRLMVSNLAVGSERGETLSLTGSLTEKSPGAKLVFRWHDLDLARLHPWLPPQLKISGKFSGQAGGKRLSRKRLDLSAAMAVSDGLVQWQHANAGLISAAFRQAELDCLWQNDSLNGTARLELTDYGKLQGAFQLPLAARLPAVLDQEDNLRATLNGQIREQGLLSAMLPGLVRETKGQLQVTLHLSGSARQPTIRGTLQLDQAGAYLPATGIQVRDIALKASLAGDRILLDNLSLTSGDGNLSGRGSIQLDNWRPASCHATLAGERFTLVNLPELQLQAKPDLTVELKDRDVTVRGKVLIPDMMIRPLQSQPSLRSSPDLIIDDATTSRDPGDWPLALNALLDISLGDHVLVKTGNLDARLGGDIRVKIAGPAAIAAQGKVQVKQGRYSAYGVALDIVRGNVLYAGGPLDQPTLDILALRTIGSVKAGVLITGTPQQPLVKLYSEPTLPDTDILAYIVLGRPLGTDSAQSSPVLMTAASALLSKAESALLQDRLKQRLGLDTISFDSGNGDVHASVLTLGKYLSPKLYVSFAQALFTTSSEMRLRYSLTDRWQAESNIGTQSGIDLFYTIEFE